MVNVWLALKSWSCWQTELRLWLNWRWSSCIFRMKLGEGPNNWFVMDRGDKRGDGLLRPHLALLPLQVQSSLKDTNNVFDRRKEGIAWRNQNLNFPVADALHVGEKGSVSDTEVTWYVVWSSTAINLPWAFLSLHVGPHQTTPQDRHADGCRVLPPTRLWVPRRKQKETRINR